MIPKTRQAILLKDVAMDFASHSVAWAAHERGAVAVGAVFTINGQPHRIEDGPLLLTMSHVSALEGLLPKEEKEK